MVNLTGGAESRSAEGSLGIGPILCSGAFKGIHFAHPCIESTVFLFIIAFIIAFFILAWCVHNPPPLHFILTTATL